MTPEQEAIKDKFQQIWIREHENLKDEYFVAGYYITGLLLEVFEEINKRKGNRLKLLS